MSKFRYIIEVYRKQKSGSDYNSTPDLTIRDAVYFDTDGSIETTADSFKFVVQNYRKPDGTYVFTNSFRVDDLIKIYFTSVENFINSDGTTISNKNDYLRFDGIITQIVEETSVDGRMVHVSGLNRLEKLMNVIFPGIFQLKTAHQMIKELIGHVNDAQRRFGDQHLNPITWASTNDTTSTEIDFSRNHKSVFELIEELSTQKINREFNAYYYLDEYNKFHWKTKNKDTDNLEIAEGDDFTRSKWTHKVWDVVNAMIADVGTDINGQAIHCMSFDEKSSAEYGLRWAPLEAQTEIGEGLKRDIQQYAEDNRNGGWVDDDKDGYPDSYSPVFDMGFKPRTSSGERDTSASNVTVTSNSEFNSAFRTEAKWRGIHWINHVLDITGKVRPKCDITMMGAHWESKTGDSGGNIIQGSFVKITPKSTSVDYANMPYSGLRAIHISHTVNTQNGWVTDIHFETDEEDFLPSRYTGESEEI